MEGHIPAPQLVSVTVTVTGEMLAVVSLIAKVREHVRREVRLHTSLASNGCDERGDAEDEGGAHVDAGDEVLVMMMW